MTRTPLFLIWAINLDCSVREAFNTEEQDLLYLERILRPLRSLAMATREHRTIDDLCILQESTDSFQEIDQVKGFLASEILDSFGGEPFLDQNCRGCAANLYGPINGNQPCQATFKRQFAGCYGYCQSAYENLDLFAEWDLLLKSTAGIKQFGPDFRLHHLWQTEELGSQGQLNTAQKNHFLQLLRWTEKQGLQNTDISSFATAIETAIQCNLEILVQLIPAGINDGIKWMLPQHCFNCIASLTHWTGQCPHCGSCATPNPPRKRNLRGDRPYFPIQNFLGAKKASEIARQYFVN
ncbi:MAG: hypothetical protein VX438_12850 [Planctomycetota bacterium]|nr:hypothetical protein [Planctomycetota bacterium]